MVVETESTAPIQRPVEQRASQQVNHLIYPSNSHDIPEPRLYPAIPIDSVVLPTSYHKTSVPVRTQRQIDRFAQEVTFTIIYSAELKGMYPKERKWLFEKWEKIDRLMEALEYDYDAQDEKRIEHKQRRIERKRRLFCEALLFARASGRELKDLGSRVRESRFLDWVRAREEEERAAAKEEEFMNLIGAEEVKRDKKDVVKNNGR